LDFYWPWKHDAIAVDSDSDGLFRRKPFNTRTLVPLGRYCKIEERYYGIAFSENGNTVRITPAEPAMGTLRIGSNIRLSAQLLSDAATQSVSFRGDLKLPEGRYRWRWDSGTLTFIDGEGGQWDMLADFRNDIRKGLFEIVEGQTTTLNFGPPFTIKTDIVKRGDEQLSINANLVGSEGEEYGLRIVRSAGRPELKILAENGDTLHTGSMEYG
jgi:hypothetical protein